MIVFLWCVGGIVTAVGLLSAFGGGEPSLGAVEILGGALLLGVAKLIELLRNIYHHMLGMPLSDSQIRHIVKTSKTYEMESPGISLYPDHGTEDLLLVLEGEHYVRVELFTSYVTQEEYEYRFSFPNSDSITLELSDRYYTGVDLFRVHKQVYVKVAALHLVSILNKGRVILKPDLPDYKE
ncbi:hypothetical protein ACFFNY_25185 [Paenibacillus hodogayensis]|uniref:Uncharacterized protein n=1 Tax=Paenibacillus hodogayensis TaxID=279208 RepID=A0ABV5W3S7_9BACL